MRGLPCSHTLREEEKTLLAKVRYALEHPETGTPCVGRFHAVPYNEEDQLELETLRMRNADEQGRRALRKALYSAIGL